MADKRLLATRNPVMECTALPQAAAQLGEAPILSTLTPMSMSLQSRLTKGCRPTWRARMTVSTVSHPEMS